MDSPYELAKIDALVGRVFRIDDVTTGDPQRDYIVRYRGKLVVEDSEAAYDTLAAQLQPYGMTPMFRWDEDRHAVIIVPGRPKPKPSNPVVNLVMFVLTMLSVAFVGAQYGTPGELPAAAGGFGGFLESAGRFLWSGAPYTASLLAILLTHEFGHYLMGRRHGVHVTLPYFIPFPSIFGTMGAFINMKDIPKNRRQLLDIGLAGPLSGLLVAIPILLLGLSLSTIDPLPAQIPAGAGFVLEGNSVLYLALKYLTFGQLLPAPPGFGGQPEWLYWLRFFFTGQPYPLGGMDVLLHPVAWAGWGGLLVTSLNLIPAGQLDGGHVLYVLLGRRRAARIVPFILVALVLLGFFWNGWWLYAALIFLLGRAYAEPLDQITPLDSRRRALAIVAVVVFILVFIPVPLTAVLGR